MLMQRTASNACVQQQHPYKKSLPASTMLLLSWCISGEFHHLPSMYVWGCEHLAFLAVQASPAELGMGLLACRNVMGCTLFL